MSFVSNNAFGTLSSAPDGSIVEHIYTYVITILRDFKGLHDENENSITDRLCKALGYKKPSEYPFFFQHQNIEYAKGNTSTDLAAFGTFAYAQAIGAMDTEAPPILKFEAKRLSSKLPKTREREYVIGEYDKGICTNNSGAIERFKNGRHGKDISNACLLGYVQSDSFEIWGQKINSWIQDEINSSHDDSLTWDDKDKLALKSVDTQIAYYTSLSQRVSKSPINLRHLWINFG